MNTKKPNPVKRKINQFLGRTSWGTLAIESVAALLVGIALLVSPKNVSLIIVVLFGLYWVIDGLAAIVRIFRDRTEWGWRLGGGILSIVVGVLLLAQPLWSVYLGAAVAVWIVAIAGMVIGVVMIIRGFAYAGWGPVVLGLLSLALGFLLILSSPVTLLVVPWVIGLCAIVAGGAGIVAALRKRAGKLEIE